MGISDRIIELCQEVYGQEDGRWLAEQISSRMPVWQERSPSYENLWDQRDAYLITYGDQFQSQNDTHLVTLRETVLELGLQDLISAVHVLPFFPYTSDDGFAVVDYEQVDPKLGSWEDLTSLKAAGFDLAYDLVVNHVSSKCEWLKRYLADDPEYADFFIAVDPNVDLTKVVRPRALPLLTEFDDKWLWTTFSGDQVDLNFANPKVLMRMLEVFCDYLISGAKTIRMDAIAYLWKEIGTTSIHHHKTHRIVTLFRTIMDEVAPGTILLTETNVPQDENFSYFGNDDEAHMVYQFSLPPLLLYSLVKHDARPLTQWATNLPALQPDQTYFNFTASHDGIGVRPLEGLLDRKEIDALVADIQKHGALVNYKNNPDGSKSPYEINSTYYSALKAAADSDEAVWSAFICSQAISLALQGVPALYVHSLFASSNYTDGVARTKHNRTINRQKFGQEELQDLTRQGTKATKTLATLTQLLASRRDYAAFHPSSAQVVIDGGTKTFAFHRIPQSGTRVTAIFNVTPNSVNITTKDFDIDSGRDIFADATVPDNVILPPFGFIWIADD